MIAGISMWMLLVLVLVLTLLPPPLEDEPVPPEGAPADEVVCAVDVAWIGDWAVEAEAVPGGGGGGAEAVEERAEDVLDGGAELVEGEAEVVGIGEEVACCDVGGVEEEGAVELVYDVVCGADCGGAVVVVVSAAEAEVVTISQASEELDPVGDVDPAGHGSQSP